MHTLQWAGIGLATYGLREKRLDHSPSGALFSENPPRVFVVTTSTILEYLLTDSPCPSGPTVSYVPYSSKCLHDGNHSRKVV